MRNKTYRNTIFLVYFVVAAMWAGACHSHKPIQYSSEALPPSEWVPERSVEGALVFRHEDPPMGIMVNTECDRYQTVPLTPLSRTLFIGFENRKEISRGTDKVDGHDAAVVVMQCTLEGTPLKVKAYTFKANECIYDIAYFATPDHFDDGLSTFEEYVRGFKAEKK